MDHLLSCRGQEHLDLRDLLYLSYLLTGEYLSAQYQALPRIASISANVQSRAKVHDSLMNYQVVKWKV